MKIHQLYTFNFVSSKGNLVSTKHCEKTAPSKVTKFLKKRQFLTRIFKDFRPEVLVGI